MASKSLKEWKRLHENNQRRINNTGRRIRSARKTWKQIQVLEDLFAARATDHLGNQLEIAKAKLTRILDRLGK